MGKFLPCRAVLPKLIKIIIKNRVERKNRTSNTLNPSLNELPCLVNVNLQLSVTRDLIKLEFYHKSKDVFNFAEWSELVEEQNDDRLTYPIDP